MKQNYVPNLDEYEIMTPSGWKNFEGIFINKSAFKPSKTIICDNKISITATNNHRFFSAGDEIKVGELKIGDRLETERGTVRVNKLEDTILEDTYEIFNADNHIIIANSLFSHQCDEFAFVRPSIAEPFWTSIFPTISGLGNCIITSTPNTDEDKFAKIWFNAQPYKDSERWSNIFLQEELVEVDKTATLFETEEIKKDYSIKKRKITIVNEDDEEAKKINFISFYTNWTNVPTKLDPITGKVISYQGETFKEMNFAAGIDDTKWQAEYECQFITTDNTLISGQKLATLNYFTRVPKFIDKWGCRWYDKILPNTTYCVVMDPSGDGQGDDAAIQVWEIPTLKQVAEWNTNTADQNEQARMLKRILQRLYYKQQENVEHDGSCNIYFSVERNAIGIGIIRLIEQMDERTFPGIFIDATVVSTTARGQKMGPVPWNRHRGLTTTPATKKRFAQDLKSLIERNLFIVRSEFLASQLKTFVKNGPSYKAKEGSKDDLVMSAILMVHMLEEIRNLEDDLDDYITPIAEDDYPHEDDDIFLPQVV